MALKFVSRQCHFLFLLLANIENFVIAEASGNDSNHIENSHKGGKLICEAELFKHDANWMRMPSLACV